MWGTINRSIYAILIFYIHMRYCQCVFFQKQTTVSSAIQVAQEKIKNIVIGCMEKEKSDPLHVYALFALHSQNLQAKCVLLCVMRNCNLMDKDGNYNEQKIEDIMRRTEPKTQSRFSFFGYKKAGDNETLKECIDKDYKNDSCEKAYVFTRCLQKQTKKSFNKLTDDLYDQATAYNDTIEMKAEKMTAASVASTLETINYNATIECSSTSSSKPMYNETKIDFNVTSSELKYDTTETADHNSTSHEQTYGTTENDYNGTLPELKYNMTESDHNSTYLESNNGDATEADYNSTASELNHNTTMANINYNTAVDIRNIGTINSTEINAIPKSISQFQDKMKLSLINLVTRIYHRFCFIR